MTKHLDGLNHAHLYAKAMAAGDAAYLAAIPKPMTVVGDGKRYYIPDGVCGFAWVNLPGNTPFGKWLKANAFARPGYPKGLNIWAPYMTQSYDRKMAWAYAVAEVLADAGIAARADGRLD
jgi:hypothetical protein